MAVVSFWGIAGAGSVDGMIVGSEAILGGKEGGIIVIPPCSIGVVLQSSL